MTKQDMQSLRRWWIGTAILGTIIGLTCLTIGVVFRDSWEYFLPWGICCIIAEFLIVICSAYCAIRIKT